MKNINKLLLILTAVLFLVLVVLLVRQYASSPKSDYYAVYLRTGDLYFGELSRFPYFTLRNVHLFRVNSQNPQEPVSVQKFKDVFWGPEDYIKINRSDVVWYTKLAKDGQLAKFLRGEIAGGNQGGAPSEIPQNQGRNANSTTTNK
jgi:hypothetical protein